MNTFLPHGRPSDFCPFPHCTWHPYHDILVCARITKRHNWCLGPSEAGKTGYPFIDALMRQLKQTGALGLGLMEPVQQILFSLKGCGRLRKRPRMMFCDGSSGSVTIGPWSYIAPLLEFRVVAVKACRCNCQVKWMGFVWNLA